MKRMMIWSVALCWTVVSVGIVVGQSKSASGLYVFPKTGQNPDQQGQDDWQCHNTAVEMTGYNPSTPPQSTASTDAVGNARVRSTGCPERSGARGCGRCSYGCHRRGCRKRRCDGGGWWRNSRWWAWTPSRPTRAASPTTSPTASPTTAKSAACPGVSASFHGLYGCARL